ncbi:MAG: hypothetical protein HY047_03840 [Acidobacteria bacterium]|nr:hypothetical protein [Acidobacteriota bacterium]
MSGTWGGRLLACAAALGIAIASSAPASGQKPEPWAEVLDQHPAIQYAMRSTTDRVAKLNQTLTQSGRSLQRDPRTGYLLPVLEALGVPVESQMLVFSKTGVQRAYISPQNPRALFFNESVVVGYVPGAPDIELAAHDPQQGVVFYTLDQASAVPVFTRRTSCLACHVSASTLNVPGMITRSNAVDDDGNVMPQLGSNDVTHETPHPDRWGGWYVTSEGVAAPYATRAHLGNITFSGRGNTSNGVFIDWINSSPETRGYLSPSSDIVALLVFDHQVHTINLLTRLNWESRVASSNGRASESDGTVRRLVNELADYLLFVDEARLSTPLTPRQGFAEHLESRTPKDRHGRSLGQLDLVNRLLRYPCSYMVYSEAFDGLSPPVKNAVYRRMLDILSGNDAHAAHARLTADDRRAIFEILRDTKPDFPGR